MKEEKGITLVALLLIIIAVGAIIFMGLKYGQKYLDNQEVEDIKANMLAIQIKITHINNQHTVDEENNPFIGTKLDLENNTTGYNVTEELKSVLSSVENANIYILNQEELNNQGVKDVNISDTEFYVVDYNSGEVFYSLGINGKYKLSEM